MRDVRGPADDAGGGAWNVLLTGASSGLGLAIARQLLGDPRYRLVLTARAASLARFAAAGIVEGERVLLRQLDVTDAEQRRAVVAEIDERFGGVDVLINNAGVAFRSVLEHVNEQERLQQMQVNFLGPMHLMRLCLPGMRARRRGRIVNVSSVAGMMAMPTMAIYSASKWALEGATEALWYEVRPWGIHVTLVEPGFIHSESFRNTVWSREGERAAHEHDDGYRAHYDCMAPFVERLMRRARATPDRIARRIAALLRERRPPLRLPATRDAWLFYLLRRLLPRRLYHLVLWRGLPDTRRWGPGR
ncbi:MAG: SDR family NAD(P)-dependent oxidoreductase [Planctomycetes bacterium]|nr:SDR family NAD(P)-dependent oxidoreductase [Planctomycetota bacterium]